MKLRFSQVYAILTIMSLFYLGVTGYVYPRASMVEGVAALVAVD